MNEVITNAVKILAPLCGDNCKIGLILGSGLGKLAAEIKTIKESPHVGAQINKVF